MTIKELLYTSLMHHASLISGENGTSRKVTWCALETIVDFESWIMPGSLLMYVDMDKEEGRDYSKDMDFIISQDISGILLLNSDSFCTYENVLLSQEHNIPIIKLPDDTNVINFTRRISVVLSNDVNEEERAEEWLKEVCYTQNDNPNEVVAEYYGYNSDYNYCCIIMDMLNYKKQNAILATHEMAGVKTAIRESMVQDSASPLSFQNKGQLVCFVPLGHDESVIEFKNRFEKLFLQLKPSAPENWKVSIGSLCESLDYLSASYYDARKTVQFTEAVDVNDWLVSYHEWNLQMMFLQDSRSALKRKVNGVLGPLLDDQDLMETLDVYLRESERFKDSSQALYIHVSTLKYRIKKIESLLQCDLSDAAIRFRLRIAVMIHRYLNSGK